MHRTNSWKDPIIQKHASIWSGNFTKREIKSPKQKTLKPFIPNTAGQVMTLKTTIMEKTTPKKRSFEGMIALFHFLLFTSLVIVYLFFY